MTPKKTYAEKLKDPRWQKKRLEILSRDEFQCHHCYSLTETLHVHHKTYEYKREPWDYPNTNFVTLCESCHKQEEVNKEVFKDLIEKYLRDYDFNYYTFVVKLSSLMPDEYREEILTRIGYNTSTLIK